MTEKVFNIQKTQILASDSIHHTLDDFLNGIIFGMESDVKCHYLWFRRCMKHSVVMICSLLFINTSYAESSEKTYHYVDVAKGLSWLQQNTVRIFSMDVDVTYKSVGSQELSVIKSEDSALAPKDASECGKYDVEDKYSNYFYYVHQNIVEDKELPLSNKFDGYKIDGSVIKKTTVFCFAN